jgi:hypothetical protein
MKSATQTVARRRDLLAQGYTSRSLRAALDRGELNRLSRDMYFVTKAEDAITEKAHLRSGSQVAYRG